MTELIWDNGTAFDFITSLRVLCHASEFGLRPSWAAGVRQRVSPSNREFLEKLFSYLPIPIEWIASLPSPKDGKCLLRTLSNIEPAGRLPALSFDSTLPQAARDVLLSISKKRRWTDNEMKFLRANFLQKGKMLKPSIIEALLDLWISLNETGEKLLEAFQEYQDAYFSDEEIRIQLMLTSRLTQAQEWASKMSIGELVERLTQGIHLELVSELKKITLIPSYWISPLAYVARPKTGEMLILFGARSGTESIVPGSGTPDALVTALKALADSTRLLILQYLAKKPMTPSELARRLHLRPPTVIHHLKALRLSGLVHVIVGEGNERHYATRLATLNSISSTLQEFIEE